MDGTVWQMTDMARWMVGALAPSLGFASSTAFWAYVFWGLWWVSRRGG